MVSIPMTFPSANSTKYLVSTVDGTVLLKGLILTGVRLLSTKFHILAIISSFAPTSGPSKVLSIRESHNLRNSNSQKGKYIEGNLLVFQVSNLPLRPLCCYRNGCPTISTHMEPAQEGAVEAYAIEGVQREQGHRIVGVESAVIALTERIAELERDNRRLRGTVSVESQRVDRLQRGMSRMQRELRQMRRLRFYDRVRVGRLEACARKHMGYRP
ncbi:hypothetical protein Tco_0856392 [Tanacetum coccineum]|uniref:Uncharacterized protein n=1 Tax=Tanacetum coccineum TaxID=301880 RepID=A0ABQ5B3C6_9ASTR